MPAKDLGTKHVCFKCGAKFYDLKKAEPICPKCGADQRQAVVSKPAAEKRSRAAARPVEPVAEEVAADAELEEDAADDEDEDEDDDDE